jgi:hypothetical protein
LRNKSAGIVERRIALERFWVRDRHYGCRLRDDLVWRGYRILILENELLRVVVLLDKGADIIELLYKPRDVDPLYHSYSGVVHPLNRMDNSHSMMGLSIDYWPGGWQLCFPNGGAPSAYRGAELGFHAEAHMLRWEYCVEQDEPERVSVRCTARCLRTPFVVERLLTLESGSGELRIRDRIVNDSPVEMSAVVGQHIALGRPFLEPGCRVELAAKRAWTEIGAVGDIDGGSGFSWPMAALRSGGFRDLSELPERQGTEDLVLLEGVAEGRIRVVNPRLSLAFDAQWDTDTYRYLWLWMLYGGHPNAPTYGRTYALAVEPFSSSTTAGLDAAIANGTALSFAAGGQRDMGIAVALIDLAGVAT